MPRNEHKIASKDKRKQHAGQKHLNDAEATGLRQFDIHSTANAALMEEINVLLHYLG